MRQPKQGPFSKSGNGSEELNKLMLRYAQANNVQGVLNCLLKGADIDYAGGSLITIAVYLRLMKLLKLVLAHGITQGLDEARRIAEAAGDDKMLVLINDYLAKKGQ